MAKVEGSEELYLNLTLGYFDANSVFISAETNHIQLGNVYSDYSVTYTAPTNAQKAFARGCSYLLP